MGQRMPRVAVVCDYALDYVGGAQTALVEQARALAAAGCGVVVISPSSADAVRQVGLGDDVDYAQVPARWVVPGVDLPVVRNSARLRARLRRILTEHHVDVVQLHSEFGVAAGAIDVAAGLRIPVVQTVHTFFWQTAARPQRLIAGLVRGFHRWLTRIPPTRAALAGPAADSALRNMTLAVAQRVDVVVSPSSHQAERLRDAGLAEVAVVPNTVATTGDAGSALDHVGEPLRLVWIGRCEPEKRIVPFVRAVVAAQREVGPGRLHAVVVGEGSELAAARRIVSEADCGAPGVEFLGRQERDRIPAILAAADLVALTSFGFDNQPMTIVEAVTAGRGVLYCDPALSEGLDGPGILAPADESGLAATLAGLARDPDRVVAASRATARAREAFTPATHARRMLTCYEQATNRAAARQTPIPQA